MRQMGSHKAASLQSQECSEHTPHVPVLANFPEPQHERYLRMVKRSLAMLLSTAIVPISSWSNTCVMHLLGCREQW